MDATTESNGKDSSESAQGSNPEEKNSTPPPQEVQPKKSKRDDRSKKDDKNVEQFMKSLNSVPTLEEKLSLVCKKYVQTADENKTLHFIVKQSEKRFALLLKEKDQLQLEFNKTVLVKSKLENLCRELQKQNKAIKEESLLKIKEEEVRRKETQAKFQNTLSEITTLLQQNNEKNAKLRDDNINMSEKFKSVLQQYQLREQQVDKMAKQMTLESQLSDAKLQKANLEYRAEKERLLAEMEKLKLEMEQYKAKIAELQNAEGLLRSQINVYTGKYDEFQNALQRSNQVFVGFKGEMDKMSKKIQKLEKESIMWKRRWETSQASLLQVCTEKQASDESMASTQRHLDQMQRLCRTLQAERTVLLNTLKEHNIERPPLPPPAPLPPSAPASAPANPNKVEAMAANCVQLRQSLAELQNQLNVLTNKNQSKEEQKPEKQKKSKSRKKKDNAKLDAQVLVDDCSIEHKSLNEELPATDSIDAEANISEPLMEQLNNLSNLKWDVPISEVVQEEAEKSLEQISNKMDDKSSEPNESVSAQNDEILSVTTNLETEKVINESINKVLKESSVILLKESDNKETIDVSNDEIDKIVIVASDVKVDEVLNDVSSKLVNEHSNEKSNEHETIDNATDKSNIEEQMLAELVSIIEGDQGQDLENLIEAIQVADDTLHSLESSPNTSAEKSSGNTDTELGKVSKKSKKDGKRITKKNIESIYEASTPSNVSLIEASSNEEIGHIEEVKSILDVSNSQS